MNKKIVVAGHICLDITPKMSERNNNSILNYLKPGSLNEVGGAMVSVGGVVANTGIALRYFGADVILIGKIGRDRFGDIVRDIMASYKADSDLIISEYPTSYTIVLAPPNIDRLFFHHMGANSYFDYDDIPYEYIKGVDLFHFGYPPLMAKMCQDNGTRLSKMYSKVKELGILTSLDMASLSDSEMIKSCNWRLLIKDVLQYVDFFVPSIEEVCAMINHDKYTRWINIARGRDVIDVINIREEASIIGEELLELGAQVVLLKCGRAGMYLITAKEFNSALSNQLSMEWRGVSLYQHSYIPDKIVSATGCGDTSIAAFLLAMMYGKSPKRCIEIAAGMGACCITEYDALSGLRMLDEVEERIDSGWNIYVD